MKKINKRKIGWLILDGKSPRLTDSRMHIYWNLSAARKAMEGKWHERTDIVCCEIFYFIKPHAVEK